MTIKLSNLVKMYICAIYILIIFISVFFVPFYNETTIVSDISGNTKIEKVISTSGDLCWPLPGYTTISSPFGYRNAPTAGATNFHGGIDLPAPQGTYIISAISGKVISTSFMGSGGCTVVVQNDKYTVIFHHINPNFLVSPGDLVMQGQVIAQVGPKNVYGFPNNPYKDTNRKSNQWSNYWSTPSFYCKDKW